MTHGSSSPASRGRWTCLHGCGLAAGVAVAAVLLGVWLVTAMFRSWEADARSAGPLAERYVTAMCSGHPDEARQLTDAGYHRFVTPAADRQHFRTLMRRYGRLQYVRLKRVRPLPLSFGRLAFLVYEIRGERGAGELRVGMYRRGSVWGVNGATGW